MPPQDLEKKKSLSILEKKKENKKEKNIKKKNMNLDLAYLGSGKTKIELKFLQEITKSYSDPLLHTSTFEFITSFLLTQKKRLFYIHWCAPARLHLLHHHHH